MNSNGQSLTVTLKIPIEALPARGGLPPGDFKATTKKRRKNMKPYRVYVSEAHGWELDCPDFETVFFGGRDERPQPGHYVHPVDGGMRPVGHVLVDGHEAAEKYCTELNRTGDWRKHERPVFSFEEMSPFQILIKYFRKLEKLHLPPFQTPGVLIRINGKLWLWHSFRYYQATTRNPNDPNEHNT